MNDYYIYEGGVEPIDPFIFDWVIRHPVTGDLVICDSFEDAMYKYHEGFNIPFKRYFNKTTEPFDDAYERVSLYYKKIDSYLK